jgi:hypothetical protein
MRFRLLRRRLTISAPRMSVRSALPWPFRWVLIAVVFGFCAAIGLWAFEFGRDIAGLEKGHSEELIKTRAKVVSLQADLDAAIEQRDQAQSIANTAGVLVATEKATTGLMAAQVKLLETDNQRLRDDLGLFEKLIPVAANDGLAIRGLQAEVKDTGKIRWQVLVIQSRKNAPEFTGRIEISLNGTLNGKPWAGSVPSGGVQIKMAQYGRFEGEFEVPIQVTVKGLTARVMEGAVVRATQVAKL